MPVHLPDDRAATGGRPYEPKTNKDKDKMIEILKSEILKLGRVQWITLLIAMLLPVILYLVLPSFDIDKPGEILSLDVILIGIMLIISGSLFIYSIYLGGTRYHIFPILMLFFYQMAIQTSVILHIPTNFKTLYLLALPILNLIIYSRYKFSPLLAPFIPLFIFWLMNFLYMIFDYGHPPIPFYNPELYLQKPKALIPLSYNIDLTTYLAFLISAVYISLNAFKVNLSRTTELFKKFIVYFLILYSLFSIGIYFSNDPRFFNMLSGVKRLSSLNTHANFFAFFMTSTIIYILSFLYDKKEENNRTGTFFKGATILSVITGSIAILLTFARSCNMFLLLFLVVNNFIFSTNKARSILWLAAMAFAGVIGLVVVQATGKIDIIDIIANRLSDDQSTGFRPMTWSFLLTQIHLDWQLLFGQGIGAVSSALYDIYSSRYFSEGSAYIYHPHNSFLHVFFDYGILGFILYFSPLIAMLYIGFANLGRVDSWVHEDADSRKEQHRQGVYTEINDAAEQRIDEEDAPQGPKCQHALKSSVDGKFNVKALILIELITFALVSSVMDAYLFSLHTIPFWILVTLLYVETVRGKSHADM